MQQCSAVFHSDMTLTQSAVCVHFVLALQANPKRSGIMGRAWAKRMVAAVTSWL